MKDFVELTFNWEKERYELEGQPVVLAKSISFRFGQDEGGEVHTAKLSFTRAFMGHPFKAAVPCLKLPDLMPEPITKLLLSGHTEDESHMDFEVSSASFALVEEV